MMIKREKKSPNVGDTKIKRKFLLIPRTLLSKEDALKVLARNPVLVGGALPELSGVVKVTKWLSQSSIVYRYSSCWGGDNYLTFYYKAWVPLYFKDDE
jgi:hypothetical protein